MRNYVHRSGKEEKALTNSIKPVLNNKSMYYFKFYGYFADLVEKLSFKLVKEKKEKRDNSKVTLGDSPQFKALSQKFNN